jgi:Na+-transporting methylmalonyl-CoA/oxaloacetate decarboxylase gamma subunit
MTLINSLSVALILMTIVFIVLAVLFLLLKLQTSIFSSFKSNENKPENNIQVNEKVTPVPESIELSTGELELIGVDEETAAMVMAMASNELNIPLDEIQFKSIKALD